MSRNLDGSVALIEGGSASKLAVQMLTPAARNGALMGNR